MPSINYWSFALLVQKLEMPENNLSFISTCWAQVISEGAQTCVCVMKRRAALVWCENHAGCPSCMAWATVPSWRDCKTRATCYLGPRNSG